MAYVVFNVPENEREEFLRALNKWSRYSPRLVNEHTHEVEGNVMIESHGIYGFNECDIAVNFVNIGESGIQYIPDDPYYGE
jgi:hypothetical protein